MIRADGPASGRRLTSIQPATAPSEAVHGPRAGSLILCSVQTGEVRKRFVELAGGPGASVVVIKNEAAQGADLRGEALKIAFGWGVGNVTVWHADDAAGAADEAFLAALRKAGGVWLTGGHPDLYVDPYLDSPVQRELAALLDRGGVIGGESAGAMVLASHLMNTANQVRSTTPPPRCYRGFGFLAGVSVFPHFKGGQGKFPLADCWKAIAENPRMLGIGVDDGAAIVVAKDALEVVPGGRVSLMYLDASGQQRSKTLGPGERCPLEPK